MGIIGPLLSNVQKAMEAVWFEASGVSAPPPLLSGVARRNQELSPRRLESFSPLPPQLLFDFTSHCIAFH